jgi:hypothetical protein
MALSEIEILSVRIWAVDFLIYSVLSACMGSMEAARRAGRLDATKAVANRIQPTDAITNESVD